MNLTNGALAREPRRSQVMPGVGRTGRDRLGPNRSELHQSESDLNLQQGTVITREQQQQKTGDLNNRGHALDRSTETRQAV
jgi:hypothetical protein